MEVCIIKSDSSYNDCVASIVLLLVASVVLIKQVITGPQCPKIIKGV